MSKRRIVTGLLVAGAMAGVFGAGAGTANAAAPGYAQLSIVKSGSQWLVTVSGQAPTGSAGNYSFSLYGSDEWFDEHIYWGGRYSRGTTDANGYYSISVKVSGSTLNEDWGGDEVYAKVTHMSYNGKTPVLRSNTVRGSY
ncbi:hypothetical protein Aph01nite_33280 [Acrocarpospora phusangensis]|uniref:Uncharacterized protein n=1 Tax=Acrocarpospora phusangensis TaxID=1070424 RepID=A0A919QCQ4_9ACTN|nr:hypothetical protein [Acrocarpospora phusangensis]GIH25018.1 hypothetical protein Aph01nite_33280 [Acrocarpospora phusangensis]